MKHKVLLADCDKEEVLTFVDGLASKLGNNIEIKTSISNFTQGNKFLNILRYVKYFTFPFNVFLHRKKYDLIVGWQQFYATNIAFFARLFHTKKSATLVIANFTYKEKPGLIGKIYKAYMKYSLNNHYVDYFHVLSHNYVTVCSKELGIPEGKFLVTSFGIPDTLLQWQDCKSPMNDYTLSIGRSNRDFEFLISLWKQPELSDKRLVIISDTFKSRQSIPSNVTLIDNVTGDASYPWIKHCNMMIIPIDKGEICSGDTVLLTGFMFSKTVVITKPSTLAEMYVNDTVDGICIPKDIRKSAEMLSGLLNDKEKLAAIGWKARKKFLDKFSRYSMGEQLANLILQKDRRL